MIPRRLVRCLLCGVWLLSANPLPAQTASDSAPPDLLHQLSGSVETLVRRVAPSVVQVVVSGYGPLEQGGQGQAGVVIGRQRAIGSGVIVDPEGYIVTNAHVVSSAQQVQVVVPSSSPGQPPIRLLESQGFTVQARVVGISKEIDLALLKIEAHGLPTLPIARYSKLRQGEMVFAFGSPEGLQNSVTMGVVSAVARQLDPDSPMIYIQTDAPINPGNSGGPLVNVDGEIVGISTFILTQSGGNEGLGFAIPSAVVSLAYPQLRKYGHVHRNQIGVAVQAISPALASGLGLPRKSGVVVSDVLPGGPAEAAGLKIEDIILSVDDRPVESLPFFGYVFYAHPAGEPVKLEVLRGSDKLTLQVAAVEAPHDVDRMAALIDPAKNLIAKLGVLGIELDAKITALLPQLRESSGVLVVARAAGSGPQDNPLLAGDIIHAVNRVPIISLDGLRSSLDRAKPADPVVLQIERDSKLTFVSLQLSGAL